MDNDDDSKAERKNLRKFEKDWKSQDNFPFSDFVRHIENFIQKKVNSGIEASLRIVLQKAISYIDQKIGNQHQEQDQKIDKLEAKQIRKIIELKKLLFDIEQRANQMYFQNVQMKESMEIERAHAKKERAESEK